MFEKRTWQKLSSYLKEPTMPLTVYDFNTHIQKFINHVFTDKTVCYQLSFNAKV